jgi:hypothetical protein
VTQVFYVKDMSGKPWEGHVKQIQERWAKMPYSSSTKKKNH